RKECVITWLYVRADPLLRCGEMSRVQRRMHPTGREPFRHYLVQVPTGTSGPHGFVPRDESFEVGRDPPVHEVVVSLGHYTGPAGETSPVPHGGEDLVSTLNDACSRAAQNCARATSGRKHRMA